MVSKIFQVFDEVSTWIASAVNNAIPIFWNETSSSLTLLGTLAVVGLGFSVVFLIIGIIQKFLHFAG